MTYDQIGEQFSRTRRRNWPEVLKYINRVKENQRVLDLGCGNGRLLLDLNTEAHYTGIDVSQELLNEAKGRHPGYRFIKGDLRGQKTWELVTDKYDWIFCVAVLHHLKGAEMEMVMEKIKDRLAANGTAVVTVWNLWGLRYWKQQLLSSFKKMRNWRFVQVPFQKKTMRECYAWLPADFKFIEKKQGIKIRKMYYSDGKGGRTNWLWGKNLVVEIGLD